MSLSPVFQAPSTVINHFAPNSLARFPATSVCAAQSQEAAVGEGLRRGPPGPARPPRTGCAHSPPAEAPASRQATCLVSVPCTWQWSWARWKTRGVPSRERSRRCPQTTRASSWRGAPWSPAGSQPNASPRQALLQCGESPLSGVRGRRTPEVGVGPQASPGRSLPAPWGGGQSTGGGCVPASTPGRQTSRGLIRVPPGPCRPRRKLAVPRGTGCKESTGEATPGAAGWRAGSCRAHLASAPERPGDGVEHPPGPQPREGRRQPGHPPAEALPAPAAPGPGRRPPCGGSDGSGGRSGLRAGA